MSEKLLSVRAKVKRAKKHVGDLNEVIRQFFETCPYEVVSDYDPDARRAVHKMGSVQPIPIEVPLISGEVVFCLRSALDQLAYMLWLGGNRDGKERGVYFPIFRSKKPKSEFSKEIQGMGVAVVDALDDIEAYNGGKGHNLWVLSELNNTDKHRMLITVGSAHRSVDLGALFTEEVRQLWTEAFGETFDVPDLSCPLMPTDNLCPLNAGDTLLILQDTMESALHKNVTLTFDIAIHEPGIVEGEPLVQFFNQMIDLVNDVVVKFEPLL